jgi:hypothetical protein
MQTTIDNIPHVKHNKVLSSLGKNDPSFDVIKAFETNKVFSPTAIESFSNINFDTIIKTNKDTNTYEVLTDPNEDESSNNTDTKKEGEDSDSDKEYNEVDNIDIDAMFKHDLNFAFISTLSIVGLFILYRMIQKSR